MGNLFKNKLEELPGPEIKETPWGEEAREHLTSLMGTTPDIPLLQTAGMTEQDRLGQSILKQLGEGAFDMPEIYHAAIEQLMKTFAGEYDPRTSDFYKGYRTEMDEMMGGDIEASRREAQLGGGLYSDYSAGAANQLRRNYANQKLTTLGGMYEGERANMLNAVPTALNASMMPTQKASGIATLLGQYGGLGREIEQKRHDAKYNQNLMTEMFPYEYGSNIASTLLNYQPWYQPQFYEQPSVFSQIAGAAGGILPMFSGFGGGSKTGGTVYGGVPNYGGGGYGGSR